MMPVLLIILIPLGALVIYAVVFDLKQRLHRGAPRSHDISSAARMARADADARAGIAGAGADIGGGVRPRRRGWPRRRCGAAPSADVILVRLPR